MEREIALTQSEKVYKYHTYFQAISYSIMNECDYLLRFEICREVVPAYRAIVSAQSEGREVCVSVGDLFDQRLPPRTTPLNPGRVHLATRHLLLAAIKIGNKNTKLKLLANPKTSVSVSGLFASELTIGKNKMFKSTSLLFYI